MDPMFLLQALVLNFQEEILFTENVGKSCRCIACGVIVFFHQKFGDFALQAPREPDQPLRMLRKKLLADAWFVVKTVKRGFRSDLYQVLVAFFTFGEDEQMVVGVALRRRPLYVVIV